jgi:tetratricopeptide (TPR) repeat protein
VKTIKRLEIWIAVLSLTAALGFLIQRQQQLMSEANARVERARESQKNRDFERAESLYQQYLSNNPAHLRAGRVDQAIKALEDGTHDDATKRSLRWIVANLLAETGDNDRLLVQIEELEKSRFASPGVEYLTAYYYLNSQQYATASRHLSPLASLPHLAPTFKSRVDDRLSRCYAPIEEPRIHPLASSPAVD